MRHQHGTAERGYPVSDSSPQVSRLYQSEKPPPTTTHALFVHSPSKAHPPGSKQPRNLSSTPTTSSYGVKLDYKSRARATRLDGDGDVDRVSIEERVPVEGSPGELICELVDPFHGCCRAPLRCAILPRSKHDTRKTSPLRLALLRTHSPQFLLKPNEIVLLKGDH
ncbi:hypothetical protein PILCRDRAFT_685994 [Piloderma croceum F 1598]|uniref:Uncharacterized protein n=1 Tax=Piloderma croceum (strain F 1598) TaxID=765440 RepID=A0A0C3F572_PILCF|nr:hypothetical protein PILCRDRAFT_16380 [Piloderma croceum F 1598]KIM75149.1 hypothetical protein PILCRDRAFT_685994 [Piloderma croceum F 1598]